LPVSEGSLFNSQAVGKVKLGQSQQEVRAIMQHDPERREAAVSVEGKSAETWSYITDYSAELMTTFTFTDGRLTKIGKAPWKSSS
jgi:hypothetical protein